MLENKNGRHYIGITTDPVRRLAEHNRGSTRSTRPFGPWKIIYTEDCSNRQEACKREWCLKHSRGYREKLQIINKYGEIA